MRRQVPRFVFSAAAVCGLVLASGCGDDDGEAASIPTFTVAASSYTSTPPAATPTTASGGNGEPGDVVAQEQEYTVQPGDALPAIAERYGVSADEIANYNNFADGVSEIIYPDQVIKIPPGAIRPETDDSDSSEDDGGSNGSQNGNGNGSQQNDGGGNGQQNGNGNGSQQNDGGGNGSQNGDGGGNGSQDGNGDAPTTTLGNNCGEGTYTIQESDTSRLAVAEKFDVTVQALDNANQGTSGYSAFYPGLEIVIPAKSDC